jgi:sugar-phosphatase
MTVQAVLFDMDGTLVDSSAAVDGAWRRFAAVHGLDHGQVMDFARGRQPVDTLTHFMPPGFDVDQAAKGLLEEELTHLDGVKPVPGAVDLMAALAGVPTALVTSAERELAIRRMAAAGLPMPPGFVPAEMAASKPEPDGYLLAAQMLGVDPQACAVFEDSLAGVQAGLAAGAQVVIVGGHTTHPQAAAQVADLTGITVQVADGAAHLSW